METFGTLRRCRLGWLALALLWGCAGGGGSGDGDDPLPDFGPTGGYDGTPVGGSDGPGGETPIGNQRPELSRIGDREITVGAPLTIQLSAKDPDGQALYFTIRSTLPEGSKFDKNLGEFTWTPSEAQAGAIVLLTFEVSDGELKDQETIQIKVLAAGSGENRPPVIDEPSDQVLIAGTPFELTLVATDPNGDALTFGMTGSALAGATLDATSGVFRWTPPAADAGRSYTVIFTASDAASESSVEVRLAVRADSGPNSGNLPPRFTEIPDQALAVGEAFNLTVSAQDDHPETLIYSVSSGLPAGARFAGTSFTWTPTADQAGQSFAVVFQVTDGEFRAVERVSFDVAADTEPVGNCEPDSSEASEPATLTPDQPMGRRSICPLEDIDVYLFDLIQGQNFSIVVDFEHADGDVDFLVTGPEERDIGTSEGITNQERLDATAPISGRYAVAVYAVQATNPDYTITLSVAGTSCQDDVNDANNRGDTDGSAVELLSQDGQSLALCAGDEDYYAANLTAGQSFTAAIRFAHEQGDLDAELTGPNNFRLSSASSDDDETFSVNPVPTTGRYLLRVYGYNGASNSYRLEAETVDPAPCNADRLEPNNAIGRASVVAANWYKNLTYCGDLDWFRTDVGAGQGLDVTLSWNGAGSPRLTAVFSDGSEVDGQTFGPTAPANCMEGRAACVRLSIPMGATPGSIYYILDNAPVGTLYDLDVDLTE